MTGGGLSLSVFEGLVLAPWAVSLKLPHMPAANVMTAASRPSTHEPCRAP